MYVLVNNNSLIVAMYWTGTPSETRRTYTHEVGEAGAKLALH